VTAVFCLRLAAGLAAALLLLPTASLNPRFLRAHLLTALGLTVVAGIFLRDEADLLLWLALAGAGLLAFVGSVCWHVEGAPGGRVLILLTALASTAALLLASRAVWPDRDGLALLADDLTSAALLGSATTAMLVGHSYLMAPSMSIAPLYRMLVALGVATLLRVGVALVGLWLWKAEAPSALETETALWLAVRWGVGFLAPLGLGWMAWETARIRSTQSATGILYVVVIFCFLGELTAQLLRDKTGFIL
jgi:hypothetical protein